MRFSVRTKATMSQAGRGDPEAGIHTLLLGFHSQWDSSIPFRGEYPRIHGELQRKENSEGNHFHAVLTRNQIPCQEFLFSLFLLIHKTLLWMGSTFPSGQMEQLELTEVKGHAPGYPASQWNLDNQDLAGSRDLVVSETFHGEGKNLGSRRIWGWHAGHRRKLKKEMS